MNVLLLPHSLPVQSTMISKWQSLIVKLICCYHPTPFYTSHTLSHTKATSSHTHATASHTPSSSSRTLTSSHSAFHSPIQSFNRSMTKLSRISSLWHYHSFHTHTASFADPTPFPTQPIPSYTSTTPLPASYTTVASVYIHWPYCRQRCSYCNFVKFVPHPGARWTLPHDVLEDAIVHEVKHSLQHSHITQVSSVFFGGGTPSLARPKMVEKVLRVLQSEGHLLEGAEVTLEVNPTSLETQTLREFKEAGINRVSIGVQSFDAAALKLLHRDHSVKEAKNCLQAAQSLFPGRISVDLMFGLPHHNTERWEREVQEAVALCCDHLSLYQLTVEKGTALYRQVMAGEVRLPEQDQMADLYAVAVQALKEAGLYRYEVSNFACSQSTESIHNKGYWQGQQYIGVGPGAHSRVVPQVWKGAEKSTKQRNAGLDGSIAKGIRENSEIRSNTPSLHSSTNESAVNKSSDDMTCLAHVPGTEHRLEDSSCTSTMAHQVIREARVNAADPASWLQETLKKGNGIRKTDHQTRVVAASEYLASGLRTRKGVTAERWDVFLPYLSLGEVFVGELGWLEDAGLVHLSSERLRATEEGLALLDAILPHLYNILHDHLR
ncbi:radical S-adenosyl methionine domain-containing protein 1, mitochondrial-like [Scylla paramamosain]|uniref:radical S-adenosyl methionine domain-containing protein 1, mitochondrial-like n=1 Tax=Scylla paramamosain TaxID=85552 RepID=UPI00308375CB